MHFLRDILYDVELKIQAGLSRYTWQSLNIPEYCQTCEKVSYFPFSQFIFFFSFSFDFILLKIYAHSFEYPTHQQYD